MKKLTIIVVGLLILAGCSKQKQRFSIPIENKTEDTLKAEIYNTWTGLTDSIIKIAPGKQNLLLDTFDLKSIYINKYPEKTIFIWEEAQLKINQNNISTDSLNQAINNHQLWTQELATGVTSTRFIWPKNISSNRYVQGWTQFDKILFKLFTDTTFQPQKNTLTDYRLEKYPAAYMLLHKYTDTAGLWIHQHVKTILSKLDHAGVPPKVEAQFLSLYFKPQQVNLRNDSVMHALSKYIPSVYSNLKAFYEKRTQNAQIKKGDKFPIITGTTSDNTKKEITFTTQYTLIDFWATWCIPCIKQMPELNNYAKRFKKNLKIISISVDSKKELKKWQGYATKYDAISHIWVSDTTNIRTQLGIKGLPHMILVNESGVIIDPDFPHIINPLADKWIKAFTTDNQAKTASAKVSN